MHATPLHVSDCALQSGHDVTGFTVVRNHSQAQELTFKGANGQDAGVVIPTGRDVGTVQEGSPL